MTAILPYRTIPHEQSIADAVSSHFGISVQQCHLLLAGVNDHFVIETRAGERFEPLAFTGRVAINTTSCPNWRL